MRLFAAAFTALAMPMLAACVPVDRPVSVPEGALASYILVDKSDRTLTLFSDGALIKTYTGIQLGDAPMGHKQFEGDERTPEGHYTIDTRNPNSAYHLSLRVSYPSAADRAFAAAQGRSPGGDIFLHGQPNGMPAGRIPGDWTDGCIAFSNEEIEELWGAIPDGTPIEIRP
jgi:murein L,D-transpeptidase YafK